MKIINLSDFRKNKELQAQKVAERVEAYKRVEENKQSDIAEFNYEFMTLLDVFMKEHYPEAHWRFDIWINKILEEKK